MYNQLLMNLSPKLRDHLHLIPSATAYLLHLPLSSAGCLRIDKCIGELVACSAAVCPNKKRLVICIITHTQTAEVFAPLWSNFFGYAK